MAQLVTLGETMAAFAPDRIGPLRYVSGYSIRTAGAESNTAIGVAKLGVSAAWVAVWAQTNLVSTSATRSGPRAWIAPA